MSLISLSIGNLDNQMDRNRMVCTKILGEYLQTSKVVSILDLQNISVGDAIGSLMESLKHS